jgi:two-component system chemotaxis sensor kinase CheA
MSESDPVAMFRIEAQELLEQIEQGLLDLIDRPGDQELVAAVFRALHTLKGSGAMFGFDALAAFTHHCETAFDQVRKGEVAATPELVSAVLATKDHMRALVEDRQTAPGAGDALLAELGRVVAAASQTEPVAPPVRSWRIHCRLPVDALVNGTRPLVLLDELRALGGCTVTALTDRMPLLADLVPTECHIGWDILLETDKPPAAVEDVFLFLIDDMTLEIAPADAVAAPVAADEPVAAVAEPEREGPAERRTGGVVRVPEERLDELMDRVGELVIAQSRLKQVAAASLDLSLRSVAEEIEQLAAELRDTMMSVRMVPIASLFGRFRRLIHDLARETGKTIELVTEGESTALDKTVIERLADPLIHLVRNAADHGLETAERRLAAGKPATGRVVLAARQAGAEVVISIKDDGQGVNHARVRAKAEEAGLLAPGAPASEADLLKLLFAPGFSTASAVTNLSGRGVGMDVVKRAIESMRGTIDMTSVAGQGSEIVLRIPLTLAIIDGLLVRVGSDRYVIPVSAVEECLELSARQDLRSNGRSFLTVRDKLVPFVRLREIFATGLPPDLYQKVVVVSSGTDRVGLVVDQILGDHQTVIKPLSVFHRDVQTFSGATILGDGSVALILDVGHLTNAAARAAASLREAC